MSEVIYNAQALHIFAENYYIKGKKLNETN